MVYLNSYHNNGLEKKSNIELFMEPKEYPENIWYYYHQTNIFWKVSDWSLTDDSEYLE